MTPSKLLKKDLFGEIRLVEEAGDVVILRDISSASVWVRWLARFMMRRESRVLAALSGIEGVPELRDIAPDQLLRSYIEGAPMHRARPADADYFRKAARLLRQLHSADVVHNDLAKEPNVLVTAGGEPAFVDFQLAWFAPRRGRLFRLLGREDLRHLLKHKRMYRPDLLTAREKRILASPTMPARVWRGLFKPVYLFLTRRVLGWADREGAGDRGGRT